MTAAFDALAIDSFRLVRSLEDLRHLPLDEIPTEQAAEVCRNVLTRDEDRVVVDVARFGSSI